MSFAIEIVIPAPIDVVFDYVHNDEKILEWSTFMVENRYPSNIDVEKPREGDKYIYVQKMGKKIYEFEAEILEYDEPYIVSVGCEMKQGYTAATYMLEEDEEGTSLTLIVEFEPKNFIYKIMYKLTGWMTRAVYMGEMERLAECVDVAYSQKKRL
ncbi:SRPBCC family protein [Bacillus toyonensis]|uniref:SRPBCC family protein n=1 Tax=Bacillus toyonensis TaxID=155322 RepID=UPI000BFE5EB6|nr:SRPBCC family protein [Bacillus toyonensis]PHB59363.1 3-isopropylmalate dehydrogenase [Bacillus toyonensis]